MKYSYHKKASLCIRFYCYLFLQRYLPLQWKLLVFPKSPKQQVDTQSLSVFLEKNNFKEFFKYLEGIEASESEDIFKTLFSSRIPLEWAAYHNNLDALKTIIDLSPSSGKEIALRTAAYLGHAEAIECLHKLGTPLEAKDDKGLTALHYAADNGVW